MTHSYSHDLQNKIASITVRIGVLIASRDGFFNCGGAVLRGYEVLLQRWFSAWFYVPKFSRAKTLFNLSKYIKIGYRCAIFFSREIY